MKNLIQNALRRTGYSVIKTTSLESLSSSLESLSTSLSETQQNLDESQGIAKALDATLQASREDRDLLAARLVDSEAREAQAKRNAEELARIAYYSHEFRCPCCGSASHAVTVPRALLPQYDNIEMLRCSDCEAEMLWPLPSTDQLVAYYTGRNSFTEIGDSDAARYLADPSPTAGWAASIDRQLRSLGVAPNARVLEIGCMHGALSIEMRKRGYDAWGIEPSKDGVKFLTENGGRGYCGTLFDDDCPIKTCDVAMSFHVFEHLPNPYEAIRKLHGMMQPGGVLHFIVPYWGGVVAQQKRQHWKWLSYPEHLHYFSRDPLVRFLEKVGFKLVDVSTTAGDHEVDEALESLQIASERRDEKSRRAAKELLQFGACGEGLSITAVRL